MTNPISNLNLKSVCRKFRLFAFTGFSAKFIVASICRRKTNSVNKLYGSFSCSFRIKTT